MSSVLEQNFLYLIWKDPQTRRNFTVGKLIKKNCYRFIYCNEHEEAKKFGWRYLDAFPEEREYISNNLFPVFASRLPDMKRRDINKILAKYNLDAYDEFELLKKSGARLPIDTYEFIDPIFPQDETIDREFFIMGIRYKCECDGKDCSKHPDVFVGDCVKLEPEPTNSYDSNAICVKTKNNEHLGYIPRYYNYSILQRIKKGISYTCEVIEVNLQKNIDDCSECIKVRLRMP